MFGEKKWWQSKTIIGAGVSIFLKVLAAFGVATDNLDEDQLTTLFLVVGSVVADVVAIWGRFKATTTVG